MKTLKIINNDVDAQGYRRSMIQFSLDVGQQKIIHRMQTTLRCCGFNNYTEWLQMTWSDQISKMDLGKTVRIMKF